MARNGPVDRVESAANITLLIAKGASSEIDNVEGSFQTGDESSEGEEAGSFIEVPISTLDTTKEVDISEIRESSLKASGYSVTSISYSGTMSFMGSHVTKSLPNQGGEGDSGGSGASLPESLNNLLYDGNGVPQPVMININHEMAGQDGQAETYQNVLVTSESYESQSESETETSYDWIAMDRTQDSE